ADGTNDYGFTTSGGSGLNGAVNAIAVQADGRIIVGGGFTSLSGTAMKRFARINADGSWDTTLQTTGFNSTVNGLGVQCTGSILVGGGFSTYLNPSGTSFSRARSARLTSTGALDSGYNFSTVRMWGQAHV